MRRVQRCADLSRIFALPVRQWQDEDKRLAAKLLTRKYRLPGSTMELRPDQGAALCDMHDAHGGALLVSVGGGKTLIGALAPRVLGLRNFLVVVPASMREETKREHAKYRQHFDIPPIHVASFSQISQATTPHLLERINPDGIFFDEAQRLGDVKSARTRKVRRWLKANPVFVTVASGTMTDKSLMRYAHLLQWALGVDNAPVPANWRTLRDWADALDEGVPYMQRADPGALTVFSGGKSTLRAVRQGFADRLTDTPGVYSTAQAVLPTELILTLGGPTVPAQVSTVLETVTRSWEDPEGNPVMEAVELARLQKQLSLGFYYKWLKPGPRRWMDARRAYFGWMRDFIAHNRRQLDSPKQVWDHCAASATPPTEWLEWRQVRDTFVPETVCVWLDDFALHAAGEWMAKEQGIVWSVHSAFGPRLAKLTGHRYFGPGSRAASEILAYPARPIIASLHAHGEGRNLQDRWHKNLFVSPPSSGKRWEQVLGRTHRPGQQQPTVYGEVWTHTPIGQRAWDQALGRAQYLEDTLKNKQKLNFAKIR